MLFRREDWELFTKKDTLAQKAGVPQTSLLKLAVKELTDNALDVTEENGGDVSGVSLGFIPGGIFICDDGPGFDRDGLMEAFSFNRPLVSSKLLRLPTRGAMGNGLRVVSGAIVAFGGELIVHTRGRRYALLPKRDDGTTIITEESPSSYSGTRIEATFPIEEMSGDVLSWGKMALRASGGGYYKGLTSPWWYTPEDFLELLHAADGTVRDVVSLFEGNTGAKAGTVAERWKGAPAREMEIDDAAKLLVSMRGNARPFNPGRFGSVGVVDGFPSSQAHGFGEYRVRGTSDIDATIPFSVDVWGKCSDSEDFVLLLNRTPATCDCYASHGGVNEYLHLPGVGEPFKVGKRPIVVTLNITTPYIPFTSDGKSPDVSLVWDTGVIAKTIETVASKSVRAVRRASVSVDTTSKKQAIMDAIPAGIRSASGNGEYRFSQRQLYYAVRPDVIKATGDEPEYGYFCTILTEYENGNGEIEGLYRDNRGTLYIPHTGEEIPVGTRNVADFERPEWTFNKILYCEKEGFFPILRAAKWPERWDCALLTSKGYASRAVKDLLDMLGEGEESLLCFCIHDADPDGTMIYETLQEATKTRGKRRIDVINLGLDPDEGVDMGLQKEPVQRERRSPVAGYISPEWAKWLQKNRIELNAMSTPLFLSWLNRKMSEHGRPKLIPPEKVMCDEYSGVLREEIEKSVTRRILRKADAKGQYDAAYKDALKETREWTGIVSAALVEDQTKWWRAPVKEVAVSIAEKYEGT